MDFSEKWGKDVEDAVRLALQDLRLNREQVDVIVLEEPSKGFFGLGSKLAKVRVQKKEAGEIGGKVENKQETKKNVREQAIKPETVSFTTEEISSEKNTDKSTADSAKQKEYPKKQKNRNKEPKEYQKSELAIRERPAGLVETEDAPALGFLRDITNRMGLNVTVKAYKNDSCLFFEISGPDSGTIIGKRGQTLDSIQYLTSLVANKDKEKYLRVIVDAENYRSKRELTLEQLANRLGEKVQKSGKSVRLEPMNPYERKVIHATLQRNPAVTTRSEGEEPYRRVIIERK
ncbi:hypothetical protein MASR2M70_07970 [Bacillota bacterium]